MDELFISIAKDFTETPGGRYWNDRSPFSGEEFYVKVLLPKFKQAKEENRILKIDLDGTYGYATSFLDESFGKLARTFSTSDIEKYIVFISMQKLVLEDLNKIIYEKK